MSWSRQPCLVSDADNRRQGAFADEVLARIAREAPGHGRSDRSRGWLGAQRRALETPRPVWAFPDCRRSGSVLKERSTLRSRPDWCSNRTP